MATIKTSSGHVVAVDDEDYPLLSRYVWHAQESHGKLYARTNIYIGETKRVISMHRMILGMKKKIIDHRNGDGLDNRKSNLRYCAQGQNQANGKRRPNKTGFKGVTRPPGFKKYRARISVDGEKIVLGLFDTPEDAARAYDKAALEHFGEFATLNFPRESAEGLLRELVDAFVRGYGWSKDSQIGSAIERARKLLESYPTTKEQYPATTGEEGK